MPCLGAGRPGLATLPCASASCFSRPLAALSSSSSGSRLLSSPRDAASSSRQRLQLLQDAGAHAASQQQRTGNSGGAGLCAHRSAVTSTVQQHRHSYSPPEARPHSHSHHREPPRDDGSVKIIMLLGLSLTLLLLPWMSRHPEFLVIPVLLAITPVVGNGVRPVLREVAAGFLTTLKLAGLAAWYDVTHDAPAGQHSSSSTGAGGVHRRQQQYRTRDFQHPQQQQPAPMGPHSPWPNPARMPDNWTPPAAAAAATAAGVAGAASAASASVGDADADWALAGPPDPHSSDPGSMQHLQQVLAADLQTQAELTGRLAAAAAAAGNSSSRPRRPGAPAGSPGGSRRSPSASPRGGSSPASSLDGGDSQLPRQPLEAPHQQQQHGRDPRTLSREAKQQLYQQGGHHPHPGSDSMDQQ